MRMGSKFRYSDRTLYQIHKEGHPVKDQPKFNRVSSLNWSRRYQMPSLSETRIYFDEADDAKKRPMSEGDLPSKMPWYLKMGGTVSQSCYFRTGFNVIFPNNRDYLPALSVCVVFFFWTWWGLFWVLLLALWGFLSCYIQNPRLSSFYFVLSFFTRKLLFFLWIIIALLDQ